MTSTAPSPRRAPTVPGFPFIGVALRMRRDPLTTMTDALALLGDGIFLTMGPYRATLIRNPEHIKRVFVDNASNYTKQTRGYDKARLVLGEGLVTSEGELWQRQRRIAAPAFHRQRVAGFAKTMTDATANAIGRLRLGAGTTIDLFQEMMALTLHIAVETLLGVGPSPELERVSTAVSEVLERTNDLITNPLSLPTWVPLPKTRRFHRAVAVLDQFIYDTIARRKRTDATDGRDILSMLLAARDEETGLGMSDKLLRDEAVTILIAGYETTANALAWAGHLLAHDRAAFDKLRTEVDTVLAGRVPTADDVPRLPYAKVVIDETLRLYPPGWMIGRAVMADDTIGPFTLKRGEFVLISPYVTQRHPGLWDRPNAFDPERFLDGRSAALPKFSYLPFGGGQRFCVGSNFAIMEAVLLLAQFVQAFDWTPAPGHVVTPQAMITLRPRTGVKVVLQTR